MSKTRLPALAELKRKLKEQPAPRRVVAVDEVDEASLLRHALAGVTALPAHNRAEIGNRKPAPLPRAREAALDKDLQAALPKKGDDWVPAAWLAEDPHHKPLSGEAADLATALRGVQPIKTDKIVPETPKPPPRPLQRERDEQAALAESIYAPTSLELRLEGGDELVYLENGVPRSVIRDLRRGRWVVQDQIDLHGCNRDEARELLAACMGRWKKEGIRCVRVVHGKGRGSPGREPVLKKLVAGWLMNYADVMAYCQARLPDGGAGALIVLLKASARPAPLL
ncbi:Smr/MutS family protein [Uliginosibacterium sp. 31-16]|uniref:Smr/MutS family protein n=1 Tax=Uliginosibacterium sp. 31-16 TaxID=3068315 RepID=UPI00273D30ED|nr:Smr/MutS family protein [Uliginosibacterium sp. 31-16]MDP5239981.1 Smr/MutS family protein [Uliginosibacterium sp. 31-16]